MKMYLVKWFPVIYGIFFVICGISWLDNEPKVTHCVLVPPYDVIELG